MNAPTRRIAFHTLGCKLNFAETATIARDFIRDGFRKVGFREEADIYVINTCSVTNKADKECRKILRRVRRRSPDAVIALVGCYAQLKSSEIVNLSGVDLVLGTVDKFNLLEHLSAFERNGVPRVKNSAITKVNPFVPSYSAGERTRAFLKVQDGCDYSCTFCAIPSARGLSRSDSIANTLKVARKIAATETREIVLTGVNISDFGKGQGETFLDLVKSLDTLKGIDRIRISSIEPNLLADELIRFVAESNKFVPHLHIPLQSGSNPILHAMRRRYNRELYADRVAKVRSYMPDCCIGVDVIVGFPGEAEGNFMETYTFLEELDISYLHVFTYSERDNTEALNIPGKIPIEECSRRSKMLHILSGEKRYCFHEQYLDKNLMVLFETSHNGSLQGHTDNYIRVKAEGSTALVNEIIPVRLVKNRGDFVYGEITTRSPL